MEEVEYNIGDLIDLQGTYKVLEINGEMLTIGRIRGGSKNLYSDITFLDKRYKPKTINKNEALKINNFNKGDIVVVKNRGKIGWEWEDTTLGISDMGRRLDLNNTQYIVDKLIPTRNVTFVSIFNGYGYLGLYHPNHFKKIENNIE